ncbi:MAG TPA: serine/threonine-protein kinase [Bryobacteraceae bacterium]|jgi:serine/threonine-protein kinase
MVGQTVLHYQFLEKLGSGGMGEIYKAQDIRLNRFVAIKVLTAAATGDPDRRRRFIQEAQAASALNHPNIITIHDIVSESGTDFMVMEFVSGKTLVDLIPKGGLRVSQVLKYAVQMADALQAAHNAGIVHRDLKPGNVMVTDSGLVKVLDFGLAKLTDRGPLTNLSGPNDATMTIAEAPLTVEGSIIGTVSYMSPEQAQGKKVDTRSDIFSFGVVLYEMVTGSRAFEGDSTLTTLSAILRDDVRPVAEFAPEAPPQLELVIKRCLKKSPDDRWQTMKDVEMALAALKHESDSGMLHRSRLTEPLPHPENHASADKRKGVPGPVLAGVLFGLVALAAIAGNAWWKHHKAPPPVEQAAIEPAAPAADAAPVPDTPDAAPVTPPADEGMTNDNVIQMVEAKVSTNQIIAQIRSSKTNFALTPSEIIRLSKAGVQDKIIEAMRDPKHATNVPVIASNPAPPPAPKPTPKQEPVLPPVAVAQPQPVPLPATLPQTPPAASAAKATSASQPGLPVNAKSLPPAAVLKVSVPDGTGFKIALAEDIPESADKDFPLRFVVSDDLRVGDAVVVAKGSSVAGAIADSGKKKFLGVGVGKMTLKVTTVDAVDKTKLNIRALPSRRSDGSFRDVDTGKPKPKGVAAAVGTEYYAYTDGDQVVFVHK